MATNTTNYNLVKPTLNETADIEVINLNMDIIDTNLKKIEEATTNINVPVKSVNSKTGEVILNKDDVGLGNVNNWPTSSEVNNPSDTVYATAGAVKKAYDKALEAFQSASNGKTKIAAAITGKGVATSSTDTFDAMVANINKIKILPTNSHLFLIHPTTIVGYLVNFIDGQDTYMIATWKYTSMGDEPQQLYLFRKSDDKLMAFTISTLTGDDKYHQLRGSTDNPTVGTLDIPTGHLRFLNIPNINTVKSIHTVDTYGDFFYSPATQCYYVLEGFAIKKYNSSGELISTTSMYINVTWFTFNDKYIYIKSSGEDTLKVIDLVTLTQVSTISINITDYSIKQTICTNDFMIYFTSSKSFDVRRISDHIVQWSFSSEKNFMLLGIREDILYIAYEDSITCLNLKTGNSNKTLPISVYYTSYYKTGLGNDFRMTDTVLINNNSGLYKMMIN